MSLDVDGHTRVDRHNRATPRWTSPPMAAATELICLICDVTWIAGGGDRCWMCGEAGRTASEVMPWSALAPALFL